MTIESGARTTSTIEVRIRRFTVESGRPFAEVVQALAAALGHPDMRALHQAIVDAGSIADLERIVDTAIGPSGLMEFVRFDAGEVLRKDPGASESKLLRLLIGNPLTMKEMAERVPDAAAYAPVTVLIAQHANAVRLSFDSVASAIAPYGVEAALAVAKNLDCTIESLLEAAAAIDQSRHT